MTVETIEAIKIKDSNSNITWTIWRDLSTKEIVIEDNDLDPIRIPILVWEQMVQF